MSIKGALSILTVAASLLFAAPQTAWANPAADAPAAKFVEKMGTTALTSLTQKDLSSKEREKRARDMLRANFDLQTIGRYALGTYWRGVSDAQKKEYMALFEDMIVKTYSQRFAEYSGQSFEVAGAMPAGKDHIVSSQIIQKDGPPINVDWRVRTKDGQMKVIDVIVESISMSMTQRSDFSSVIQNGGGDIESLLASLRKRKSDTATAKK